MLAIRVEDGNIVTYRQSFDCEKKENFESDIKRDILKLVYLNRYRESTPQIAYITGIGVKKGAFATSISHDSHNILAVGCQDEDLLKAINTLIEMKGGLVVVKEGEIKTLPLPIGGIISEKDAWTVSEKYQGLNKLLQVNGCKLQAPFMTLSFMSLLVIPEIKIGEKGLFDGNVFSFIEERSL